MGANQGCCSRSDQPTYAAAPLDNLAEEAPQSEPRLTEEETQGEPTEYSLDQDIWALVWYRVVKADGGSDHVCLFCRALGEAVLLGALQVSLAVIIYYSLKQSRTGYLTSLTNLYENTVQNFNVAGFRRLSAGDAETYCGSFGDNYNNSEVSYAKNPLNSWSTFDLAADDRSLLDATMLVMAWWSLYSGLFLMVTFLFNLSVVKEYALIRYFFLLNLEAPSSTHAEAGTDIRTFRPIKPDITPEKEALENTIPTISYSSKCLGFVICLIRMSVATVLLGVGWMLFIYTKDLFDLVMNSLALGFIFELDEVIFAVIKVARGLDQVKWTLFVVPFKTVYARYCYLKCADGGMVAICAIAAFVPRIFQHLWAQPVFSKIATMCLLLGPTPKASTSFYGAFPVTGFCESILNCSCPVPSNWHELQCLTDKRDKACEQYNMKNLHRPDYTGCKCQNKTEGEYWPMTELTEACKSMFQFTPDVNFSTPAKLSWVSLADSKNASRDKGAYGNGPPPRPVSTFLEGFPRARDVGGGFAWAGPFTCAVNKVTGHHAKLLPDKAKDIKPFDQVLKILKDCVQAKPNPNLEDDVKPDGTPWSKVKPERKKLFQILGWNESSWNDGGAGPPPSHYMDWDQLSPKERTAATGLYFNEDSWGEGPVVSIEAKLGGMDGDSCVLHSDCVHGQCVGQDGDMHCVASRSECAACLKHCYNEEVAKQEGFSAGNLSLKEIKTIDLDSRGCGGSCDKANLCTLPLLPTLFEQRKRQYKCNDNMYMDFVTGLPYFQSNGTNASWFSNCQPKFLRISNGKKSASLLNGLFERHEDASRGRPYYLVVGKRLWLSFVEVFDIDKVQKMGGMWVVSKGKRPLPPVIAPADQILAMKQVTAIGGRCFFFNCAESPIASGADEQCDFVIEEVEADAVAAEAWQATCSPDQDKDLPWKAVNATRQNYWRTLGWNQSSWENDKAPPSEHKSWDLLSPEEKNAAKSLCYDSRSWHGLQSEHNLASLVKAYAALAELEASAAAAIAGRGASAATAAKASQMPNKGCLYDFVF